MRGRPIALMIVFGSLVFGALFGWQAWLAKSLPREKFAIKKLRVLSYSSFAGTSGPGPELIAEFKKVCQCDVEMVTAGDAGLILERLRLQQSTSPFDVVVGLDQMALSSAEQLGWRKLLVDAESFLPIPRRHLKESFIPIDWAPLSFIYRASEVSSPQRFEDLLKNSYKGQFAIQDPRSSSPGLQLLQWVRAVKGQGTREFLTAFKDNVASVSPSWSFSYGLFKKNQSAFVFSYVTSLAYHWGVENDRNYRAVEFAEGHPVQVEFAAVPASCRECELGEKFVQFLLEPASQKVIMERNFMFPARRNVADQTVFAELPQLKELTVPTDRDLTDWLAVFQ